MNLHPIRLSAWRCLCLLLLAGLCEGCTCLSNGESRTTGTDSVAEPELHDSRTKLLDFAFKAGTALPVNPHLHTRSETQNDVLTAALDLRRVDLAETYVTKIDNWRRGTAHADIALYYARHDDKEQARKHLHEAEEILNAITDWHTEHIHTHMARCHAYMNEDRAAQELVEDHDTPRTAGILQAEAETCTPEEYTKQLAELDKLLQSEDFDSIRKGLHMALALHRRFYTNAERRAELEQRIQEQMNVLSPTFKLQYLSSMARHAIKHSDTESARRLLLEAKQRYDEATWKPRFSVPWMGRLAMVAFEAGEKRLGHQLLDKGVADYEAQRDQMVNIDRVETLCPLAEAYQSAGLTDQAAEVYRRALDEAVVNPNSRPRAVDLSLICRSMAKAGLIPSAPLWDKLKETYGQLGVPW